MFRWSVTVANSQRDKREGWLGATRRPFLPFSALTPQYRVRDGGQMSPTAPGLDILYIFVFLYINLVYVIVHIRGETNVP